MKRRRVQLHEPGTLPAGMPSEIVIACWHLRQLVRAAFSLPVAETKPLYELERLNG